MVGNYPTTDRRERKQQELTGIESRVAVLLAGRTGGRRKFVGKQGKTLGCAGREEGERRHQFWTYRFYSKRITSRKKHTGKERRR